MKVLDDTYIKNSIELEWNITKDSINESEIETIINILDDHKELKLVELNMENQKLSVKDLRTMNKIMSKH